VYYLSVNQWICAVGLCL